MANWPGGHAEFTILERRLGGETLAGAIALPQLLNRAQLAISRSFHALSESREARSARVVIGVLDPDECAIADEVSHASGRQASK